MELVHMPSERALRELPVRVVTFLTALASEPALCATLEKGGYGPTPHAEGMRLLQAALPYPPGVVDPDIDTPARKSATELHEWLGAHLARFHAAFERFHPECLSLLSGLQASDEAQAVLAVSTLLRRLDETEKDAAKSPVLATLAERGFDRAERTRLEALVTTAQSATLPESALPARLSVRRGGRHIATPDTARLALYRWFVDWSATAKSFVKRKDWLIRMGLAERRRAKGGREGARSAAPLRL